MHFRHTVTLVCTLETCGELHCLTNGTMVRQARFLLTCEMYVVSDMHRFDSADLQRRRHRLFPFGTNRGLQVVWKVLLHVYCSA